MSAPLYIDAPASRDRLAMAYDAAPPHLRPIIEAVRDHRCGMFMVGQSANPFRLPHDPKRPAIIIIGDDFDRAAGPEGFHMPSLRRAIRSAHSFAVVSCEPIPAVYAGAAGIAAITRRNTLLVETRPEQEIAWSSLIRKLAPGAPLLMAVVKGGNA